MLRIKILIFMMWLVFKIWIQKKKNDFIEWVNEEVLFYIILSLAIIAIIVSSIFVGYINFDNFMEINFE